MLVIIGIGTDIVKIERIENACQNPRFLDEYFGISEREFLKKKANMIPSVANNFAAKEAFSKALGMGVRGFSLCEVEVLRDELGKPYVSLCGKAKKLLEERGVSNIHLTLSNTDSDAVAFVILEG